MVTVRQDDMLLIYNTKRVRTSSFDCYRFTFYDADLNFRKASVRYVVSIYLMGRSVSY